jgi:hypothetical protein
MPSDTAMPSENTMPPDTAMPPELRTDRAHPARVYDYLLGGKDNFEADRVAAEAGLRVNPNGQIPPRENRAFLRRAVRYLAREAGVTQFLDIGTGIPTTPNVHQVARSVVPWARVVYVDNDPVVLAQSRALLAGSPDGLTQYLHADLRDADGILDPIRRHGMLDFDRPVGLLLLAVLHFIDDDEDPYGLVRRLLAALPAGSYLALSHLTGDFDPHTWEAVAETFRRDGITMRVRTGAEIERFFDGLDLVPPGMRVLPSWRPDPGGAAVLATDAQVSAYGGVARKR